jgi:hypothetical protein
MATFRTLAPEPPPVQPGTYLVRVIAAKDRVSSNGNDMIVMRMALPDGRELPCTVTFVESARTREQALLINPKLAQIVIRPQAPVVLPVVEIHNL